MHHYHVTLTDQRSIEFRAISHHLYTLKWGAVESEKAAFHASPMGSYTSRQQCLAIANAMVSSAFFESSSVGWISLVHLQSGHSRHTSSLTATGPRRRLIVYSEDSEMGEEQMEALLLSRKSKMDMCFTSVFKGLQ